MGNVERVASRSLQRARFRPSPRVMIALEYER